MCSPLVHIAGDYMPDTGQCCVVCGTVLLQGAGWDMADRPMGFEPGTPVTLTEDDFPLEVQEHLSRGKRCTPWSMDAEGELV